MYESAQLQVQLAHPCANTRELEIDLLGTGHFAEADQDNGRYEFDPSLVGRRSSFEFPYPSGYADVYVRSNSPCRVPFEPRSNSAESGTCLVC